MNVSSARHGPLTKNPSNRGGSRRILLKILKSGRRDSNPRRSAWKWPPRTAENSENPTDFHEFSNRLELLQVVACDRRISFVFAVYTRAVQAAASEVARWEAGSEDHRDASVLAACERSALCERRLPPGISTATPGNAASIGNYRSATRGPHSSRSTLKSWCDNAQGATLLSPLFFPVFGLDVPRWRA